MSSFMARSRKLVAIGVAGLGLLVGTTVAMPQESQTPPALDGDAAEALADATGPACQALVAFLRFGTEREVLDDWFLGNGPWPSAGDSGWDAWSRGTLDGGVQGPWLGAPQALHGWLDELREPLKALGPWTSAKSKTIGVEVESEERFWTRVLLDLARSEETQAWIELRLAWPVDDPSHCVGAEVVRYERSHASEPMFVERTLGVLQHAPEASRALSLGGREWAPFLDDAAGTAWFGHQGMAVGDVNGDGLPDLYVGMPSGLPNHLLIQDPDGSVRDTAFEAGVAWFDDTKGVLLVDLNGDGNRDLVTALHHVLVIHAGDGHGNFQVVAGCPAPDESPFYSVAAADVDLDGDLDLFATRYVRTRYGESIPIPMEDARNGPSNHLFVNLGQFRFADGTEAWGLDESNSRFSLAASFADYDRDGDPDLYVANDFGRNRLWRNEGQHFRDVAAEAGVEDQAAGMGVAWGDYDGDGDQDLYVSNMFSSAGRRIAAQRGFGPGLSDSDLAGLRRHALGNSLWRQGEIGHFTDASESAHVRMGRWSWGAVFVDLNADGLPDLLAPNGFMTGPGQGDL
ncbi:MAG: VCBS repeat-containing protein [Planctomycetes bacterium]|nr:VCBS repeat-containing protein [Planctomycetota bacterium]